MWYKIIWFSKELNDCLVSCSQVDQLSSYTDEETVILTASMSDGTLSHLGSDYGKIFLENNENVKSQFLKFCMKGNSFTEFVPTYAYLARK